ncbi:HEAT repeat domain-containing protein [Candidatus Fermentibacterales bacterium]|nr:HEAT repeat domain-containing protein [Candidatus Fermentibacterales bacterium]
MAEETTAERLAERLVQALANASDESARRGMLSRRMAELDPASISSLLAFADDAVRKRAEMGQLFLYLLELPTLESELPEGLWRQTRELVLKDRPPLDDTLTRFGKLSPGERPFARAKISLLLEIQFLLIQEEQDQSSPILQATASTAALRVLKSVQPGSTKLEVETTGYPVSSRRVLAEILSELDFLEVGESMWEFRLNDSILPNLSSGGNMSSRRAAGATMSQAMANRLAENLVKRFGFIVRSIGMYPPGHPAIQPSVDSFMSLLDQLLTGSPMVTLTVMGGDLMVNETQIRKKSRAIETFVKDLNDRNVNSVSLHPGVGSDDVLRFASVFNKSPIYIREHGGIQKLLERREVDHITIDQFHYALVSEDGTVVGQASSPEETALEDVIFGELVERLERGDSLRDLPNEKVGEALKKVLQDAGSGVDRQRNLLAGFVAALDPSILEKGLLSRRDVQRDMAWSAVRRIIKARLRDLSSKDEDVRLEAVEKLMGFALIAVERNKDNTVMQLLEAVTEKLRGEDSPDCLFAAISATGTLLERLISRGKLASAEIPARILKTQDGAVSEEPDIASARRRALAEAGRRIDTPEVAEALLQRLLSHNEVIAREAEILAAVLPLKNLIAHLLDIFLEPDIKRRARAYRILKALGNRALPQLHGRLMRLPLRYETQRDPETLALVDDEWYVARNVMGILAELQSPSSEEVLVQLCSDPDERIRHRSLLALASVSQQKSLMLSLRMLNDRSVEVAKAALDIAVKEARFKTGLAGAIIEAYRSRPDMWAEFLDGIEWLLDSEEVREFLASRFEGEDALPFGDPELTAQAASMLGECGGEAELTALESYMARVSGGGMLKRKSVAKAVLKSVSEAATQIRQRLSGAP